MKYAIQKFTLLAAAAFAFAFSLSAATPDTTTSIFRVYYESGSYVLDEESKASIDSFLQILDKPLFYRIQIAASTDSVGSISYNDNLSDKRANGILDLLTQRGLDSSDVVVASSGERSVSKKWKGNHMWKDRAVSITVKQFDFITAYKDQTQSFLIDPSRLNVLNGAKGTKLIFPANAFIKKNGGAVYGMIEIELTEYYTRGDFVLNALHTSSKNQLIESGGTINIRAKQNGQELRLRDGIDLQVKMPSTELKDGMQAFFGSEVDSTHQLTDWHLQEEYGTVESRTTFVDFGRAESLLSREAMDRTVSPEDLEFLQFFGEPGNEEELGILVGNAFRKKNMVQLRNLFDRYDLDMVVAGKEFYSDSILGSFSVGGRAYLGSGVVYRKSTKRVINLAEETFEDFDFAKTDGVKFLANNNGHTVALTEAKLDFSKPALVQDYYMRVNKLGWINCDRFVYEPGLTLTDLEIEIDPDLFSRINLCLVFDEINSVMPGLALSDGRVVFRNVPIGMKALLFGHTIDNNQLATVAKYITISKDPERIDLKPTTQEEFEMLIDCLSEPELALGSE